jgi:hypothetical protein
MPDGPHQLGERAEAHRLAVVLRARPGVTNGIVGPDPIEAVHHRWAGESGAVRVDRDGVEQFIPHVTSGAARTT